MEQNRFPNLLSHYKPRRKETKGAQVKIEGTLLNLVAMILNLEAGTGL
jgi:hypothetical protein